MIYAFLSKITLAGFVFFFFLLLKNQNHVRRFNSPKASYCFLTTSTDWLVIIGALQLQEVITTQICMQWVILLNIVYLIVVKLSAQYEVFK